MKLEPKEVPGDLSKVTQPVISQPRFLVRTDAPTVSLLPVAELRWLWVPAALRLLSALLQVGSPPSASVSLSVKWISDSGKVEGVLLGGQSYRTIDTSLVPSLS